MTHETALVLLHEAENDHRLSARVLAPKKVDSPRYALELVHRPCNLKMRVRTARRFQEVLETWSVL